MRIRCHISSSTSFHGIKWKYSETNKGSKSKPRIVSGQASCSLGLELWRKHKKESEILAFSSMPSSHPSPILIYTVLDLGREVWNKHKNYRLKAHLWSRGRRGSGSDKTRWNSLSQPRSMLLWPLGVSSYFGPLHPSLSFILLPGWYCWNSNPIAASFLLKILLRFLLPSGKAQTSLQHIQSYKAPITILIAHCACPLPHTPQCLVIAGRSGQLPAHEQATLFITSVPLNMSSFLCLRLSSSFPPSSPFPA